MHRTILVGVAVVLNFLITNSCFANQHSLGLMKAVNSGSLENARIELSLGGNPNYQGKASFDTPLIRAIWHGSENIIRLLLESGAQADGTESIPLVHVNSPAFARLLIEKGAQVNRRIGDKQTLLFDACEKKKWAIAKELLRAGADPNEPGEIRSNTLPIHVVAKYAGSEESLSLLGDLLTAGADPNATTITGETPLHLANSEKVIHILVSAGANPDFSSSLSSGRSLVDWNFHLKKPNALQLIQTLLRHGTDPARQSTRSETALHSLFSHTPESLDQLKVHLQVVHALLIAGAPADTKNLDEFTPLHSLILNYSDTVFSEIPDPNKLDYLITAIQMLKRAGAKINAPDRANRTPFHLVVNNLERWISQNPIESLQSPKSRYFGFRLVALVKLLSGNVIPESLSAPTRQFLNEIQQNVPNTQNPFEEFEPKPLRKS